MELLTSVDGLNAIGVFLVLVIGGTWLGMIVYGLLVGR